MHPKDFVYPTKRIIEISRGNTIIRIRQISDTHHKGDGFRDDLFKKFVATQRKDKNSYWIHTGDIGNPDRNSRREIDNYANANRKDEIITQNEKNKLWVEHFIIPEYEKIKDSCLGMIAGDHYMVIDGEPCTKYICKRLNIPYIDERMGFVNVSLHFDTQSMQYIIHARHGRSASATHSGDVASLVKQDVQIFADLHLGGHTHRQNTHTQKMRYITEHGNIRERITCYMRGGSFLDNPGYAKKAEYTPLPCGWGEVELTIGRMYHGNGKSRPLEISMVKASIISA